MHALHLVRDSIIVLIEDGRGEFGVGLGQLRPEFTRFSPLLAGKEFTDPERHEGDFIVEAENVGIVLRLLPAFQQFRWELFGIPGVGSMSLISLLFDFQFPLVGMTSRTAFRGSTFASLPAASYIGTHDLDR